MAVLNKALNAFRVFSERLSIRRDNGPIDTIGSIQHFVSTRSSFVAQKTLYGYLKTRMGTRYPSMFDDDVFIRSINIAKSNIFAACLSDLSIYAFANAFAGGNCEDATYRAVALRCFADLLNENLDEMSNEFSTGESTDTFVARLAITDWQGAGTHRANFTESPRAILYWAPIAPELKKQDTDIVSNSINFAWHEVRQNFTKRLVAASVLEDISGGVPDGNRIPE